MQVASSDLVHRFEAAQRKVDMLITGYVTDADCVARELLEVLGTPAVLYRCDACRCCSVLIPISDALFVKQGLRDPQLVIWAVPGTVDKSF